MITRKSLFLLIAALAAPCTASAQQTSDFSVGYILPPENNFVPLVSGQRLTYPSVGVNRTVTATFVIVNRGASRGSVNAMTVTGASFILTGAPAFPAIMDPGRELRIGVVFAPRQAGSFTGSVAIALSGAGSFQAELAGTTALPDLVLAYLFPSEGNVIPANSGATLAFPPTRVNTSTSAVVSLGNRGLGGGRVTEISLSGDRFRLTGVGSLPLLLEANTEMRLGVVFEAKEIDVATGVLRIVVDDKTLILNLEGRAAGARFLYEIVDGARPSTLAAGVKVAVPDTAVGQTSALTVQVRNAGNAEGSIAGISMAGDGFQLSNLPFFPQVLAPESAVSFQVIFSPKQPGAANGRLRIGQDSFDFEATAKGPQLVYSYRTGAARVQIRDNRNVLWTPVQPGQSSQVDFIVRNAGNMPATVAVVLVVDTRSAFKLTNAPPLPAVVDPGAEIVLPVLFSPVNVGDHAARLHVDDDTFNLIGVASALPPLPAVEIRGPGRSQNPLQQRSISVVLSEPYPLPLTGALTLAVNSGNLNVDPAVQFSTGGRTAAFAIPAGETRATFQGRPEIFFQTGSVSGTITFQAAFAVRGANVTPDAPPSTEVVIPPSAPQVLEIQLEVRQANTLSVVVTGLATTRALDQLELQFVSSPKYSVPVGKFTLDLSSASASWYRRRDSEAFGSLFTASIPFTVQAGTTLKLEEVFQSVSATLVNGLGRSNTLSITPKP